MTVQVQRKPCIYCGERTYLRTRGSNVAMCFACLERSKPSNKCEACRGANKADGSRFCAPCSGQARRIIQRDRPQDRGS